MTSIFVAQLLLPVILVLWMALAPPRSRVAWGLQLIATLLVLWAMVHVGIWLFPPFWTPYAAAALVVAAALWAWRRGARRTTWPEGTFGWSAALLFGAAGVAGIFFGARAIAGAQPPALPLVALAWPLRGGTYMVVNGGNEPTINAHMATLDAAVPRFQAWRGQSYGVDIVQINALGLRANAVQPSEPSAYRIYGAQVLAPCTGEVVAAIDGLADMQPPEPDRAHLAGNHVLLRCAEADVLLGHFRPGSLRVAVGAQVGSGDLIAEVGNSGNTGEPHLHIHAQRPGPPGAPVGGEPLPITLGGRFVVRGERIELP